MRPASHTQETNHAGVPSLALQLQRGKKTRRRRSPEGPASELEVVMWHKFKAGIFSELAKDDFQPHLDYSSPFQFLPTTLPPASHTPPSSPSAEETEQPEPQIRTQHPTVSVTEDLLSSPSSCLLHGIPSMEDKFPDLWKRKKTDQRAFNSWHTRLTENISAQQSMPDAVKEYFRQRKPPPLTQRADGPPPTHRSESTSRYKSPDNHTSTMINSPLNLSTGRVTGNGLSHPNSDDSGRRSPGIDRHFEEFKLAVEAQKLQILQEYQKLNSESDHRRSIEIRAPIPCRPNSPTGGSVPLPTPTSLPSSPPPRMKAVTRTSSPAIGGKRRSEDMRSVQDKKSRSGSNSITRSFKKTFEKSIGAMHSPRGRRPEKPITLSPPGDQPTSSTEEGTDELLAHDEGPGLFILSPKSKDRTGLSMPLSGNDSPSSSRRRRGRSRRKSVTEETTSRVTFSRANSFGNSHGRPRSGESSDGISSAPEPPFDRIKMEKPPSSCTLDDAEEERSVEDESTND